MASAAVGAHSPLGNELQRSPPAGDVLDDEEEELELADLFLAVNEADAERVKAALLVVPPGADVNGRNKSGETVVHVATLRRSLASLQALHAGGADLHQLNKNCENGLHIACRLGELSLVQFFADKSVCLDGQTRDGDSPIHVAAKRGHFGIVELLCQSGACPNAQDRNGETPLHVAAAAGNLDCVKTLIQHGARIFVEDRQGWTPLEHAIKRHQTTIALMLINAGAPIDHVDQRSECPLHLACREGLLPVVQALCAYGCRVDVYNALGVTPLHIASKGGHLELARCLLLAGANPQLASKDKVLPEVMALAQGHSGTAALLGKMKPERRAVCVEQLVPTQRPLPRIKLKVFGDSCSGKSSLIASLRSNIITGFFRKKFRSVEEPNSDDESQGFSMRSRTLPSELSFEAQHDSYTRGVHVQSLNITGAGDFSVWDFSGYQPYYIYYDHFIGDTSCVHMVLFNLMDSFEIMQQKTLFWVNFVMSRIPPREPLGFCGKPKSMARIILVGTHCDRAAGVRNESGLLQNRDAERILHDVIMLTRYRLDVCDRVFLVNTSEAMSPDMKALRQQLSDWRSEILRHLPFANGFLDVVASKIPEWAAATQFPVFSWQQFVETVRTRVNPLCSEDHLKDLIQELQYTGEVVYLESESGPDMIVLSPQWLCSVILGFLLSNDNISQARVTGSFTCDDIQFMIADAEANQLLRMLIALDLCTRVEVEDEVQYEFPSLNFLDSLSGLWEREAAHANSLYGGVQFTAARSQLVHVFPRVQCSLRRSLKVERDAEFSSVLTEAQLFQWYHGSKLTLAGVECVLRIEESDQVLRLRARGPRDQAPLLFGIYQDIIHLLEQVIEDTCPGMEYEMSLLSPKDLRSHSKVMPTVPQAIIFKAITAAAAAASQKSLAETVVTFEDGVVQDSLANLLCFGCSQLLQQLKLGPDLHISCLRTPTFQKLCSLFDPVDPHGKDWCLLAVRLGMSHSVPSIDSTNEWLRSRTAKILDEWGKEPDATVGALVSIFIELGRLDAAALLQASSPLYTFSPIRNEAQPPS